MSKRTICSARAEPATIRVAPRATPRNVANQRMKILLWDGGSQISGLRAPTLSPGLHAAARQRADSAVVAAAFRSLLVREGRDPACYFPSVEQEVLGPARPPVRAGTPLANLVGWLWIALVDGATIGLRVRADAASARIATVLYVFGQALALGLVATGAAVGWRLLERAPRGRWLLALGMGWLFAWIVVGPDLAGALQWLPSSVHLWLVALLLALIATALAWLGLRAGDRVTVQRWPGVLCLAAGGALVIANAVLFPVSYPGVHLLGLLAAGWIAARGMPWLIGDRPRPEPHLQRILFALAATGGAIAVLRAPANRELLLLLREPGAALAPYLAELRPARAIVHRIPEAQRQWFEDRSGLPAIPASKPPLVRQPLVIMLSIDSFRADLLADPRRRADLPELFRLREESTYFSRARSAGTSTAPSLAALFSGLYYSQQHWEIKEGAGPDVYPNADPNLRFPQLLAAAGVTTVSFQPVRFLLNE